MTDYTTRTKEFGEVTFTARGQYVWLQRGNRDEQICYGGDFRGNTVMIDRDDDGTELKKEAKKWMKQRREWMRKEGM